MSEQIAQLKVMYKDAFGNNAGKNGFEVGEQAEPVAILGSKILTEYL